MQRPRLVSTALIPCVRVYISNTQVFIASSITARESTIVYLFTQDFAAPIHFFRKPEPFENVNLTSKMPKAKARNDTDNMLRRERRSKRIRERLAKRGERWSAECKRSVRGRKEAEGRAVERPARLNKEPTVVTTLPDSATIDLRIRSAQQPGVMRPRDGNVARLPADRQLHYAPLRLRPSSTAPRRRRFISLFKNRAQLETRYLAFGTAYTRACDRYFPDSQSEDLPSSL